MSENGSNGNGNGHKNAVMYGVIAAFIGVSSVLTGIARTGMDKSTQAIEAMTTFEREKEENEKKRHIDRMEMETKRIERMEAQQTLYILGTKQISDDIKNLIIEVKKKTAIVDK